MLFADSFNDAHLTLIRSRARLFAHALSVRAVFAHAYIMVTLSVALPGVQAYQTIVIWWGDLNHTYYQQAQKHSA